MLKNNVKKIIISLIAIFLVIGVFCTTFATDDQQQSILDEIEQMLQEENQIIEEDGNLEEIEEGENNKNTNTELNTNTNLASGTTNTNENLPEETPYAGIEDYTGLIFVAIFAVSAVYAYKKVREYNA